MKNDFYVYFLLRKEDGTPFYVGKGVGKRIDDHEKAALTGEDSHKARIIRKIITKLGYLPKKKVAGGLIELEAFALEINLIAEIGRYPDGPLVNKTDGGEGFSGLIFTPEHRSAISASWDDPEKRARMIAGRKRAWADPIIRARMILAIRTAVSRPEWRAKMAAINDYIWKDLDIKQRHHDALVDMWNNPDIRERAIAGMVAAWQDEELSAARIQSMRDGWARRNADGVISPERGWYSDPDTKARAVNSMTETWNNPEKKAARIEKSRITRAATYGPPKPRKKRVNRDVAGFAEKISTHWKNEGYRKEQTERITRVWEDPAVIEKASASAKDSWKDPEVKARRSQSMRDGWERRRARIAEEKNKTTD